MSDIVVVDDGRTYVSTETAEVATEEAARAKQWAQESERQANIATSNADIAVQAKDDAVLAKNYAEAAITDTNLVTVATDLQATPSNIKTVSTNISNVNSVASNITNVNAVAGNATNIKAVNANKTNIDKVAGDINRVKLVADDIASVHTVAVDISNVIDVASNKDNINTVAIGMSDVMRVSTSISNVNAVADDLTVINAVNANKTNINAVNTNKINIDTVAGINTDVSTVAGIASDVITVSGISADVTAVKNNATNINAVNSNKTNIDTVASIASDVSTVASDVTNINKAVKNLPAINAAPTYANNSKIWAEGLDREVTPLGGTHSSKVWAQIAEQAASGVQNPANRDLSNLSADGNMIIDSANGTISNCILEIPQNIKLKLENNVLTLKAGSILTHPGDTYKTYTTKENKTYTISSTLSDGMYSVFVARSSGTIQGLSNITKISSGNTASRPEWSTSIVGLVYYNTDTKLFNFVSASGWYEDWGVAYPVCVIEMKSGVASFAKDSNGNDMIFNGACFVGHYAIVYPGIKALAANGLNDDGGMNSIRITTNSLNIVDIHSGHYIILQGNQPGVPATTNNISEVNNFDDIPQPMQVWHRYYVKSENRWYIYINSIQSFYNLKLVKYTYDGTTVTDFTICQPVRTATVEMLDKVESQIDTVQSQIDTNTTAIATKADNSNVVHKTGNEDIFGIKNFYSINHFKNSNYTGDYDGYQYLQQDGNFIQGLRENDGDFLNYIQYRKNGTIKALGTFFAKIADTPSDSKTLFNGDLDSGDIQLSESFMNFNELVVIYTDDNNHYLNFKRISTYYLNMMLSSNYGEYYAFINDQYQIYWYIEKFSGGTTTTLLKYHQDVGIRMKKVLGVNRINTI